jgi:hypothetical protein
MTIHRLLAAAAICTGMIVLSHATAFAQGTPLFAVLVGGNEVSGGGAANAGDGNAYGSATVIFRGTDTLCWAILVNAIDPPNAAHIHGARAGVNGDILVNLGPPQNELGQNFGNPGTASGCVTDASTEFAATLRAIKANPSNFYINVHSGNFPAGGVRGQLF